MTASIYYFTASGFSLLAARTLAEPLQAELIAIPPLLSQERIVPQTDVVGFVFPVYHATFGESGIPHLVQVFLEKLDQLTGKYLFGVCTHSGFPGLALESLEQRLAERGGSLSFATTVQLDVPYQTGQKMRFEFLHQPLVYDEEQERAQQRIKLQAWQRRLDEIIPVIQSRTSVPIEKPGRLKNIWLKPFMALQKGMATAHFQILAQRKDADFWTLTYEADRGFQVKENCSGCGSCAKVCPVGNIEMQEKKPHWLHHCENCTACFHWCPRNAIGGKIVDYEKHMEAQGVTLKDMLHQAERVSEVP